MSFTSEIKRELAPILGPNRDAMLAELAALCENADVCLRPAGIRILTENAMAIRKLGLLMRQVFNITVEVRGRYGLHGSRARSYEGVFQDRDTVFDVLAEIGFLRGDEEEPSIEREPDPALLETYEGKRAYLRGAFLSCGSVTDPGKKYHLEMVSHSPAFAERLRGLLEDFDIHARVIERHRAGARPVWVLYLKDGSEIVDVLNVIGAVNALLAMEQKRVEHDVANRLNRVQNFELANSNKAIQSAVKCVRDIEYLKEQGCFASLPYQLREIATLREENLELSLEQLGRLADPPLGKSGVNHRLKKLSEYAEELREKYPEGVNK